jgi:hypothetical protein
MIIEKNERQIPFKEKPRRGGIIKKRLKCHPFGVFPEYRGCINLSIIILPLHGYAGDGFNQVNFMLIQR